jgi:hypothetical protein
MDRVSTITMASRPGYLDIDDPVIAYQQWWMRIKQLLKESEDAKEKGQWKKAQDLLFTARQTARSFHLNPYSVPASRRVLN